jgi:signal peptidase I
MMSDEHSTHDWATGSAGSSDLTGGADGATGSSGFRGASAGPATGGYHSATGETFAAPAQPRGIDEPDTAPLGSGPVAPRPGGQDPGGPGPDRPGPGGSGPGEPGSGEPASGEPGPAGPASGKATRGRSRSAWRELPILIVVAIAIALVIKTFVVQPFFIPSSSMEQTLLVGDKVLVNKIIYHFRSIQPGDIIVFNGVGSWDPAPPPTKPPSNPFVRAYDATLRPLFHSIAGLVGTPLGQTDYIKRVIGVAGDHVVCNNACAKHGGPITVNGVPLRESSYLYPGADPSTMTFNIVVPPGRVWVMGDNRSVSFDSRLRQQDPGHGTIPDSSVVGRAFVVIWPPSHWRILPIPSTFNQPGINTPASAGQSRLSESGLTQAAANQLLTGTTRVVPSAPYLPLAVGVIGAVPLTWLQRRARNRLGSGLRRRVRARTRGPGRPGPQSERRREELRRWAESRHGARPR